MTPRSRFVQAGGVRLHYLEWEGNGPPAVLLHATGLCAGVWTALAASLAPAFHGYAFDQRGHGDSDKPEGPYVWDHLGQDLAAAADALGLRRALLVGHSSGGVAVLHAAALRPDLAWRLILVEPTLLADDAAQPPERSASGMAERTRQRRAVWDSLEQVTETLRARDLFRPWREDLYLAYIQHGTRRLPDGRVALKCPPEVEAQYYELRPRFDAWPYVAQVRCPILLINGARSHLVRPQSPTLRRFLELAPQARVAWVEGAGHMVPQERPDEVARLVWDFVRQGAE